MCVRENRKIFEDIEQLNKYVKMEVEHIKDTTC